MNAFTARTILCLVFILSVLAASVSAAPPLSSFDRNMINEHEAQQERLYRDSGYAWNRPQQFEYFAVPNFERKALELADGRFRHIGTQGIGPFARNAVETYYLSSLIRPGTPLGHDTGLGPGRIASVLWKHHNGEAKVLGVTITEHQPNLDWQMSALRDIIGRH